MEYIDWIISSVVFITVVALVLLVISNLLPLTNNSTDLIVSDVIYQNLSNPITVYNVSMDNNDNEVYGYSINLDKAYGRAGNTFIIDYDEKTIYGTITNTDKFYNYQTNINSTYGLGALIDSEDFEDYNYEDTFSLIDGAAEIKSGILETSSGTKIQSLNNYSRYLGTISTDANNVIVYVSYIDEDNFYYCSFARGNVQIYRRIAGGEIEERSSPYPIENSSEWRKLYYGNYKQDNDIYFFCGTEKNYLQNNASTSIGDFNLDNSKILIESKDNKTYIDDLKIYDNVYGTNIKPSPSIAYPSLSTNLEDNVIIVDYRHPEIVATNQFVFTDNITKYNADYIKIYKNENGLTKAVFFPHAKEFWANIYADKPIDIYLESSNLYNFKSPNLSGVFKNEGLDSFGKYRIPFTFIPNKNYIDDDVVSFNVNFNLAFSEISDISEGKPETPKLVSYTKDHGFKEIMDFNLYFNSDTNQAHVLSKFPTSDNENNPIYLFIIFNNYSISNNLTKLTQTISFPYEQHTAQSNTSAMTFYNNQIYLYNFYNSKHPILKQTIMLNLFDKNGLIDNNCNFEITSNITIRCNSDALLKVRYRFDIPENVNLNYPKLTITKTKEQIIPQDVFENLSGDSFYARILNKTLDVNFNRGVNPPYKNNTKFLYNNGLLENATIFIKPIN